MTQNLTLPSVPGMTWSTSNPAVVTAQGVVTRPVAGQGDGQATLTATFTHRGLTDTKTFPITVKQRVAITREQLAAGLVHYYKLDETSGTTLADSGSAGAAGNATLVNPAKADADGRRRRPEPGRLRRLAHRAPTSTCRTTSRRA